MKKLYIHLFSTCLFLLLSGSALAQQDLTNTFQKNSLTTLSKSLNTRFNESFKKAYNQAKQKNWDVTKRRADGSLMLLQGIDTLGFPIYVATNSNIISAGTIHTNNVQPGGSLGLNLNGSSSFLSNKLAVWDGSTVYSFHQEFAGKTITNEDGSTLSFDDHSTHVAGTMIAKGVYAPVKGMAFGATTLRSFDFNSDLSEISAVSSTLLLSNHSYGGVSGWSPNADGTWTWYGLPGDGEEYRFGYYSSRSASYDQIAFNAPKYLMVFAAGNARGYNGPVVGTNYFGYNSRTDQTIVNKGPRLPGISSQTGYDVIDTWNLAKNILSVGAVNPLPYGPSVASDVTVAYFSSFGPTDDGRIKPDICADGVNVLSSFATSPTAYGVESGTSMATPATCGSLYLLQEYYAQKNSGTFMLAATLKGLACHTAFDSGNPGPDYIFGWGLLDMIKATQAITENTTKSIVTEKTLAQGQTQTFNVIASGNGPLKATICWTDPAGTPSPVGTLNSRAPKLVNDLDVRISDGSTTFKPWILDPNNPSVSATTGDNIVDNVEQVYIANAVPGVSYTITVTHKGTLVNGSQNFSLIVTGVGGATYCTSAPTSSADSRINNVTFAGINNTPGAGCTTYSNYTNLTATVEQGKTYPLSLTLGTCGANFNKIAKVFIDWNGNGTFTDANELVTTTGVINATGTFTANVTVPTNLIPGNNSLIRVVLTETTDPATVTPCGTYAKGETQDYKITFTKPLNDVGIIAVNTPTTSGTCSGAGNVSVRIKNFGTAAISAIPVTVTLTSGTGTVATLTDVYNGTLPALAETDFTLSNAFTAVAGATYTISASTNLATDQIASDNQTNATASINIPASITNANVSFCGNTNLYNLSANGDGAIFWYKNLTDALPFTSGTNIITAEKTVNNTFYAGLNDFSGDNGPATKSAYTAGNYNQFTGAMYITTTAPMLIKSARLYIGNSGKITFNASTEDGAIVSTTTIDAVATRANPAPGVTLDDATDQGAVYNLNLALPAAGNYIISIAYPDNATIFRSNGGVTGYPFSINGIFSITKNNATLSTDANYYKNFYYYFYNMHVQSLGCVGAARIATVYTKPAITSNGVTLTSNYTKGIQWYLNDKAIPGAVNTTYTPLTSGIYRFDVTTATGCTSSSDNLSFVLAAKDNSDGAEISLGIFPIPTSGTLNLAFNAVKNQTIAVSVLSMVGQSVYKETRKVTAGPYYGNINLNSLPSGTYIIQLVIGDKTYTKRISVIK